MIRDTDPTPAHGIARPGVAYVIRRGPRFDPAAAARGVLRPGGEYFYGGYTWHNEVRQPVWAAASIAAVYTPVEKAARETFAAELGGVWQEVIIEIPAD